jgi:hypothetical protein
MRCNPDTRHILYTSDKEESTWDNTDFRQFLTELGAGIKELVFDKIRPLEHFVTEFRNAFYKLDVLHSLAQPEMGTCSLLLDSE